MAISNSYVKLPEGKPIEGHVEIKTNVPGGYRILGLRIKTIQNHGFREKKHELFNMDDTLSCSRFYESNMLHIVLHGQIS